MRTNADRAEAARAALDAFIATDGPGFAREPMSTQIKDLITNLLHLARREAGVEDMATFATMAANMAQIELVEDEED